jgi:hypothetical protein
VKTLTSPTNNGRVEAVDELVARVLGPPHREMEARNAPEEARAVLHVAHSFADELSTMDPHFDRMQFIREASASGGPSASP